jgi:hypothetical protein
MVQGNGRIFLNGCSEFPFGIYQVALPRKRNPIRGSILGRNSLAAQRGDDKEEGEDTENRRVRQSDMNL